MKKLLLAFMCSILTLAIASAALTPCMTQCSTQKNGAIKEIVHIKKDMEMCRPNLLDCMNTDQTALSCRKTFIECRENGKMDIKQKTIDANNNFNACMKSCETPSEIQPISFQKESSFCVSFKQNSAFLQQTFGKIRFQEIIKANKCVQ